MGEHDRLVSYCTRAPQSTPNQVHSWTMLKYPIPKERRIKLAKIFFHLSVTPGMPTQIVAVCADAFKTFTRSKNKLSIEDMRLPWMPIYTLLKEDLFLSRRQFEYTYVFSLSHFTHRLHIPTVQATILVSRLHSREFSAVLSSCCH